jgi:PAS domain-containing protein
MAVALKAGRLMREKEIIIERPDGTRSCVLPYIELIRDEAGGVVGAVNMLVDITERKRGEEELREKDRFIRHITEVTPVVLGVFDLVTSRHTYFSKHAVNLYGYTQREFEEIQDPVAVLVHPEDMPRVRKMQSV